MDWVFRIVLAPFMLIFLVLVVAERSFTGALGWWEKRIRGL